MSVPVDLDELASALGDFTPGDVSSAYLITVGDDFRPDGPNARTTARHSR